LTGLASFEPADKARAMAKVIIASIVA